MKIINYKKVKAEKIDDPQTRGVKIRWAIKKDDGAPTFALRVFELKPGGYSEVHSLQSDFWHGPGGQ